KVRKWVDKLDHTYLNESLRRISPTTENLARYLFERLQKEISWKGIRLSKVRVAEAEDTWVGYSKED
ncbi:MAG: 6-carboxytetrahydropterin synthase, partial [Candidatus Aerophobetes bacterium]|nr:6-carboxytetrahydropterin synthase [Candidatus Aerophobetes bacterium]